jgi:superfamily I DNA and/or RNA helicase
MQLQDKKYEVSAWQALAIAKAALEADPSLRVLLLTPFRNQANLLHKLVIAVLSQYLERVKSGTIHIAQGQEADLVLMDLVTPEHAWLMGYMGDSNRNLACVGFSRARRQLMVLPGAGRLERNSLFSNLCRNSVEWEINWRDIS